MDTVTLEQREFELIRSTYTWIFFKKYTSNTVNAFSLLYDLNSIFFSLA